jgi:hypothetical protein
MSRKVKETPLVYARRYTATLEVYVRMVGPEGLEASLCTKARSLLEAAGLPVLQRYQSADEALSTSGSGGAMSERFVSPSTPTREGPRKEFDISSPAPRMPGTSQWAPGPVQGASPPPAMRSKGAPPPPTKQERPPFHSFGNRRVAEEEDWERQSLSPSQSNTEVAALLMEMKEARIQDAALRKKELELLLAAAEKKPVRNQSIFQVKPIVEFPKFADKDHDLDHHLDAFSELCNMMNSETVIAPERPR